MAIAPMSLRAASRVRAPQSLDGFEDYEEEDSQGLLQTIGTSALSGVARVGNLLDLPGSAVRDVLGGENPFDQFLPWNWTTDENRLSGRDLMRRHGLVGQQDTYGNFWGGLGAEILLDPTTYLSFGASALTKGGKLLQAAGKLDDVAKIAKGTKRASRIGTKVGDVISGLDIGSREAVEATAKRMGVDIAGVSAEPVQSFMRASIPFTDIGVNIGTGPWSQSAAKAIDYAVNPSLWEEALQGIRPTGAVAGAAMDTLRGAASTAAGVQRLAGSIGGAIKGSEAIAKLAGVLQKEGNLAEPEARAVAGVWNAWAEGYLKEDLTTAIDKRIKAFKKGGDVPEGALLQSEQPAFYSKMRDTIAKKLPKEFTKEQLMATLKNEGVKAEEIADAGLEAAFDSGKLTQKDVADYLDFQNEPIVVSVLGSGRGAKIDINADDAARWLVEKYGYSSLDQFYNDYGTDPESIIDQAISAGMGAPGDKTKFQDYKIPGGSNYREILLKSSKAKHEGHFGTDVLTHARVDDVTLPDGTKTLRIQEVQSDLHQAGKKQGYGEFEYKEPAPGEPGYRPAQNESGAWNMLDERGFWRSTVQYPTREAAISGYVREMNFFERRVADAPFKKSWPMLTVKHILRMAAKEGYDAVAIVDGADIAKAVGGPPGPLSTFYNNILTGELKKYTKKWNSYLGEAVEPNAFGKMSNNWEGAADEANALIEDPEWAAELAQAAALNPAENGLSGPYSGKMQVFQITDQMRKDILAGQPLYQKGVAGAKGATSFAEDGKAIIQSFSAADVSTHVHELAHVMRRHLTDDDMKIANDFVKAAGEWTTEQEELFARGFENYLRTGTSPSSAVAKVFEKIKEWMTKIYQNITGSEIDVQLSPEIKELYGRLVRGSGDGNALIEAAAGVAKPGVASAGFDVLMGAAKAAGAAHRFARGLFDPTAGGVFDKTGQMASEASYTQKLRAAASAREELKGIIAPLDEISTNFREIFGESIKSSVRSQGHSDLMAEAMVGRTYDGFMKMSIDAGGVDAAAEFFSLPASKIPASMRSQMEKVSKDIRAAQKMWRDQRVLRGIPVGLVEDVMDSPELGTGFQYLARTAGRGGAGGVLDSLKPIGKILGLSTSSSQARTELTRQMPSEVINKLLTDDGVRYADYRSGETAVDYILKNYGQYLGKGENAVEVDGVMTKVPKWTKQEHAEKLAEWVRRREQFPIYNRSLFADHKKYTVDSAVSVANADAIYDLLHRNASDVAGPTEITLKELLERDDVGFEANEALTWFSQLVGKSTDEAAQMGIPEDVANAVIAMTRIRQEPSWMTAVKGALDVATEAFKRNVTLPFPAFSARNLTGGQFVNMVSGLIRTGQDIADYTSSLKEALNLYTTGNREFLEELFVHETIDPRTLSEGVRGTDEVPTFGYIGNPANVRKTYGEVSLDVQNNPLAKLAGLREPIDAARTAYGTVMKTGEKTSAMVEYMNRASMYLYLTRKKGWDPAAAAAKVKELQLDYSALAPFEKDVMRRMMPFYSFTRRMAPFMIERLAEAPGGAMAQTIRMSRQAANADASTPDWVTSTLSIPNPLKTPEEGGASYITGFGLPFEVYSSYFEGPRAAGRELLSQVNPVAKAPLEYFTNQSFFQTGPSGAGRPLDDLDPTLGRTIANIKERFTGVRERRPEYFPRALEFAVSNSPLSRYASTARQITDPRKTIPDTIVNTLTGARVTDITPAARDAVLRDRSIELMKKLGGSTFSRAFFLEEEKAMMSPGQRALAEELERLQNMLAQRAKARKEARMTPQSR